ncbi:hypothetical protein FSP39_021852 [Pinctada imbricata]|uniref:RING-type domain-containing protein n=1 Tax=Pinctada imbricata TaxID=66713 RepID=A0AA88Y386_PINIB|nr:hypothetical protein FSP39_021852 [Pinctada imbricata]
MLSYDTDGHMNTSLYDKRDDFNFSITNFPFLCRNIPSSPAYGVFISQLIRYARASTKYTDFVLRARRLSDKLLSQGYVCDRLTSSLRKFYGRYGELVIHYDVPLSRTVDESIAGSLPSIQTENGPIGALSSALYEEKYDFSLKHPQYNTVSARVESFKNWSYNEQQHYRNLIPAGFFYTGNSDIVRCFCCDIGLAEWDPGDDPWEEHARHSPNCKYLKEKKGESYINKIQAEWRKIYNPKHEAYNDYKTRLDSYQGWPDDLEQRPDELAMAGFFYSGEGDVVRCHYCDGGLREWEAGDHPWTEHAKWFPFCKYIMKVKGIGFIEEVARQHEAETLAEESRENPQPSNGGHSNYSAEELMQIILEYEDRGEPIPSQPPTSAPPRAPRSIDNTPSPALASKFIISIPSQPPTSALPRAPRSIDNTPSPALASKFIISIPSQPPTSAPPRAPRSIDNTPSSALANPETIAKENEELKNKLICIKCNSKDRNMVFIPCGHRLMCESCSEGEKRCRKCKKVIKKKVKTFLV